MLAAVGVLSAGLSSTKWVPDVRSGVAVVAMLSLAAVCALATTGASWKGNRVRPVGGETYTWLIANSAPGTIIATNEAYSMAYLGGFPSLHLPRRRWDPNAKIPDDMSSLLPERMAAVGAKYVVIFAGPGGLPDRHFGEFVAALSRRQPLSERLAMRFAGSSGVVYELVPRSSRRTDG